MENLWQGRVRVLACDRLLTAIKPVVSDSPRVFELRTYNTTPGNLSALNDRFRNHTIDLFSKHGMGHFGYWILDDDQMGAQDTLILLALSQVDGCGRREL